MQKRHTLRSLTNQFKYWFMPHAALGTFQRCLLARQMACLVRQLDYQHLSMQIDRLLPQLITVVKDQAPAVQCYGLHALHHLATGQSSAQTEVHSKCFVVHALQGSPELGSDSWAVAVPDTHTRCPVRTAFVGCSLTARLYCLMHSHQFRI